MTTAEAAAPGSRYERLRADFDRLTRGLDGREGRVPVTAERWRGIVTWLFNCMIELLLSGARSFWSRLAADEQATLRAFARDLGLRPRHVATETPPEERREIVRILRKALRV